MSSEEEQVKREQIAHDIKDENECVVCRAPIDLLEEEFGVVFLEHGTYYLCEEDR